MTPKVSIVTVCFNALPALQKTAANVLSQRYDNIEYIIVDGASSDGTLQWLQTQADPRLSWSSEPDGGIYDAMNKGARRASGEWIIFMNAGDCFASQDVLSRIFGTDTSAADIIYGDVVKNGTVKPAEPPHNSHRMFFCHQSVLVRTKLAQEVPFDIAHKMSADFKFFKTMWYQQRRFRQVNFPVADFDTTGVSNARRSDGLLDNIRIVWEMDNWAYKLRLLPHLVFPYLISRIRNK